MNPNDIMWANIKRWQKLRKVPNEVMAESIGVNPSGYINAKSRRSGILSTKIPLYIKPLGISLTDLFDEWTDEEWERFVKESGASE